MLKETLGFFKMMLWQATIGTVLASSHENYDSGSVFL
jgi:hypothetical protein